MSAGRCRKRKVNRVLNAPLDLRQVLCSRTRRWCDSSRVLCFDTARKRSCQGASRVSRSGLLFDGDSQLAVSISGCRRRRARGWSVCYLWLSGATAFPRGGSSRRFSRLLVREHPIPCGKLSDVWMTLQDLRLEVEILLSASRWCER